MNRSTAAQRAAGLAAGAAAGLGAYLLAIRPWHRRWGATDDEIARAMLGDEWVNDPTYVTNRAVTVYARPAAIWPWLVQMGELPRGGFYSFAPVERLLGLRVLNAERVLSEFQHLEIGDPLDRSGNLLVQALVRDRALVLGPPAGSRWGCSTWSIGLFPLDDERTRLVSRVRVRFDCWSPATLLWLLLLDPGQFAMERQWLLGVKERAERTAGHAAPAALAPPVALLH
jgi:hypothetical protein